MRRGPTKSSQPLSTNQKLKQEEKLVSSRQEDNEFGLGCIQFEVVQDILLEASLKELSTCFWNLMENQALRVAFKSHLNKGCR